MAYDTALRGYTSKRIEEIESADILVGIPCYNNEKTISHVIKMVTHGLARHYKDKRSVVLIADGGSTDDTREVAREFETFHLPGSSPRIISSRMSGIQTWPVMALMCG